MLKETYSFLNKVWTLMRHIHYLMLLKKNPNFSATPNLSMIYLLQHLIFKYHYWPSNSPFTYWYKNAFVNMSQYILQRARQKCENAQCPYGILRYRDDRSRCTECYCNEPCYGHECHLPGTKCAVEVVRSRPGQSSDGIPEYR